MKLSASSSSDGARLVAYVPSPCRTSRTLIRLSAFTASRSELRDRPSSAARSASRGSFSPGRTRPGDDHLLDLLDRLVGKRHDPPPGIWSPSAPGRGRRSRTRAAAVAANTAARSASDRPAASDLRQLPPRRRSRCASRQTGQSEPNMIRSAPNALSMTSATGANAASGAPGGASVTRPDSLHAVFGRAASARIAARHRLELAAAMRRLARMVQDQRQLRHLRRRVGGGRDLMRQHDEVVAEPGRRDRAQAADDVGAAQPVRVGLGLHLVPDADQVAAAGPGGEPGQLVGDRRAGQVGPADHPGHQRVGRRDGQHLRRLGGDGHGLHQHGCGHPGRAARAAAGRPRRSCAGSAPSAGPRSRAGPGPPGPTRGDGRR